MNKDSFLKPFYTPYPPGQSAIVGLVLVVLVLSAIAQRQTLERFETLAGWTLVTSDQVKIDTAIVPGRRGRALRIDFNFLAGSGYCGISKEIPMQLPPNYRFSFYLKADAPVNNLEFKLVDRSGENVWWNIRRNYQFPKDWQKIVIKKRHISFAWGPTTDHSLKQFHMVQFFISSATGGSGSIYLDDFSFEELAVPPAELPQPLVTVSSSRQERFTQNVLFDGQAETGWHSKAKPERQIILLDFGQRVEIGGLILDWNHRDFPTHYRLLGLSDQQNWEPVYTVSRGKGGRAYLSLKNCEYRYLKFDLLQSSRNAGYGLNGISVQDYRFSEKPEVLFSRVAADHPRGYFPRYLLKEQTYWTIVGVPGDRKEALLNEDGMAETDKQQFSIEPFLFQDGEFFTWHNMKSSQELERGYLPVPTVRRTTGQVELRVQAFADGPADSSLLYLCYTVKNPTGMTIGGNLYLAVRPFQVNPPWQFLNFPGGLAPIHEIQFQSGKILVNDRKTIFPLTIGGQFGAVEFDQGDITDFISQDSLPGRQAVCDHFGYASAALKYAYTLSPGTEKQFVIAVPFYPEHAAPVSEAKVGERLKAVAGWWEAKLNRVRFRLPPSANRLVNSIRSNLAYILINRDGAGLQPGSRSYERSWIRDGSLTSSALLKFGIQPEVKEFLEWYSRYQYPNGKVPCVVDRRGPDPVPENDSHGELIFAFMEYFRFTGDTVFLRRHFSNVAQAVNYLNFLSAQRRTPGYQTGDPTQQACYGLLPESISHEGYSAKPMHSYWDDFFAIKGYQDAVEIARILGKDSVLTKWQAARDTFQANLLRSIERTVRNKQIDFIPGCVELGDFDATSTAIAVFPCNQWHHLPQPYAGNTFDKYYHYFQQRLNPEFNWRDYTPYETRLIGTFTYLGKKERAHQLLKFFFNGQRPPGWNGWAEVVREGLRTPGFIGDMPHTWVGSDFVNAARSFFVYEDEEDQSLVIGAGLYREWIDAPEGMAVSHLPTYYGELSYSIQPISRGYRVKIAGNMQQGKIKIKLRLFKPVPPKKVKMNGRGTKQFDRNFLIIDSLPAEAEIYY